MPQDVMIIKNYEVDNISIRLTNDSHSWANSLSSYLSLPENCLPKTADINLSLHETDSYEKLDELINLPGIDFIYSEREIFLGRPINHRTYKVDLQVWIDLSGFGRSWIDLKNCRARAVRLKEAGVSPLYSNMIFGHHNLMTLLSRAGYSSVHASCIQVGGKGIIFTGKSGSGKSTAAYSMLRKGHPILADDLIQLKKAKPYKALSISDIFKIRQTAIKNFFPELRAVKPLHSIKEDNYYKVTKIKNLSYINNTEVEFLIIFERTGSRKSSLEKVNPSQVVGDLFPVTIGDTEPAVMERKFNFLIDFLENVRCYRAYMGTDMDYFASCIENLVSR